jgi:hypothetical protein
MTMRDPQGPSLLIDAVRHRLKAEFITGHEDTHRRIAIVADHLPVLIHILDDLQHVLKGQPVRAPTHVLPSPFGGVSEAFRGPMQGWRCGDMARGSALQDVNTRDSAPVEEPCAQVGQPDDDHTVQRVGSRDRAVTQEGSDGW